MKENVNSIDWTEVILEIKKLCTSELAQEHIEQIKPLTSKSAAEESLSQIEDFKQLLKLGNRPFAESLDLYYNWASRLEKNAVLKPVELKDVRHFLSEVLSLKDYLNESQEHWPQHFQSLLFDTTEPLAYIDQIINQDGSIRTDASEKLYKLHQEKSQLSQTVEKTLEKLVKQHNMENILQDKFVTDREGRLVVPVKSGMQHDLEGIIHAASHSRQTVFMEPKLVIPLNNRLKQIEQDILTEIDTLLRQLSDYLYSLKEELKTSKEVLLTCDQLFSKAKFALLTRAHGPQFSDNEVRLTHIRHPLLALKSDEKVVPNTVQLSEKKQILILTGPNAGGKTVLLKSIGLAAQMARHGLPICADEGSILPFFKSIKSAVGDLQSVDENLSTFAGHLNVLNHALEAKGMDQLLLIDEICGSTDPEEGGALARSFINAYSKNNCFAVITSHLSPLKSGWPEDSKVINGSLEYDNKTGRPTYQFIMGIPGESLALQTAIRIGVNKDIIDQAMKFLSPETKEHQKKIAEAESLKKELIKTKKQLDDELKLAHKQKSKYQTLIEKFEKDREKLLKDEVKKAKESFDDLLEKAKVEHTFKKHETLMNMQAKLPKVVQAKNTSAKTILTAQDFEKAYPPGSKVFVSTLGKDAIVQSTPNNQGHITVLSGSMQISVHWNQLNPPMKSQNPTGKILKGRGINHSILDSDRVIDLRGKKVEDALETLELQLDTAALNEEDRVKIIHGHGTESLKRTVRQYLSRSTYVKSWQAGSANHGGDGVTWAEL